MRNDYHVLLRMISISMLRCKDASRSQLQNSPISSSGAISRFWWFDSQAATLACLITISTRCNLCSVSKPPRAYLCTTYSTGIRARSSGLILRECWLMRQSRPWKPLCKSFDLNARINLRSPGHFPIRFMKLYQPTWFSATCEKDGKLN